MSTPQLPTIGDNSTPNGANLRHNLTPEEIAAKREAKKQQQKDQKGKRQDANVANGNTDSNNKQQPQPQQKKQSSGGKDFTSVFHKTFPTGSIEYVDTHVHIDAVLGRLKRSSKKPAASSCCAGEEPAVPQETATETPGTTTETPETTTTTQESNTETQKDDEAKQKDIWDVNKLNNEAHLGNFGGALTVCCEPGSYDDAMEVLNTDKSGKIFGAFGVHPHEASKWNPDIQKRFEEAMAHPKVVAWGECGLDYYYNHSAKEAQRSCFIDQINLAVKYNKPLVVHTREAEEDTLEIMFKHVPKEHFIHIHCCTSSVKMVKPLLDHFPNLFVGFTGCITFKNNEQIIESLSAVPVHRLLLETDGPYMAPIPFRGAVAHSGMIPFIAIRMAEVKEVSLEDLMTQVRKNTKAIYGF
jgi:TatD DNase family protein